jgi:hypothetical protein
MLGNSTTQTFEETYKHAYSHGLEAIYALENVDLKSIRRLNTSFPDAAIIKKEAVIAKPPSQLEFDFGKGFRGWIAPFILHEPIQVLELSRYAEKILLELGKRCLSDLVTLNSFSLLKGIGQGHLEEIKERTQQYFKNKELEKTNLIDFSSFMRCIILGGLRKKMSVCLKKYSLDGLVTLLPSESMELRRLTPKGREEWVKEAFEELRNEEKIKFVKAKIGEVTEELIKPWMRFRQGITTRTEVLERLESLTMEPASLDQNILFLSDVYYPKQFPFGENMYQCYPDVYCVDAWHDQVFREIVLKANTYFYKPSVTYLWDELVFWITREFAKSWQGFPEGMIKRVLLLCPDFYLWKGNSGKTEIKKRCLTL